MSNNTRNLIKESALTLFANNGYDETSIEKISSGAGIKKSSLYSFFTSKEALFWEIYEDLENEYYTYMERLLKESEHQLPIDRLHYLFKQYLICTNTESKLLGPVARTLWNRIMFFPPAALKDRLLNRALTREMDLCKCYQQIVEDGIKQGFIRDNHPEEILLSYYSLRQGLYSLLNVFMSDLTEEQKLKKIEQVWHTYSHGIATVTK